MRKALKFDVADAGTQRKPIKKEKKTEGEKISADEGYHKKRGREMSFYNSSSAFLIRARLFPAFFSRCCWNSLDSQGEKNKREKNNHKHGLQQILWLLLDCC